MLAEGVLLYRKQTRGDSTYLKSKYHEKEFYNICIFTSLPKIPSKLFTSRQSQILWFVIDDRLLICAGERDHRFVDAFIL